MLTRNVPEGRGAASLMLARAISNVPRICRARS